MDTAKPSLRATSFPSNRCEIPNLLHVFPSFGIGGVPLRMVRIINHLGERSRHTIVALDGNLSAAKNIANGVKTELVAMPRDSGGSFVKVIRYIRFLRRMRPRILLTYNWGAIEWAAANRVWGGYPHIHLEAGFGIEEASSQLRRRVLARQWVLRQAKAVVVPSHTLEHIALEVWRLPRSKLIRIPNGVDLGAYERSAEGISRANKEVVIGTVAPLRPEKNVGRLVRAFANLDPSLPVRLVVAGDGSERNKLQNLVGVLGLGNRVTLLGHSTVTTALLGSFDIFCLSSDTEQMPNALLEAMAVGLPVAAVDVGDVRHMVAQENRAFIVPRDDPGAFSKAIAALASNSALRQLLGERNRQRVESEFQQTSMFAAYERLFLAE